MEMKELVKYCGEIVSALELILPPPYAAVHMDEEALEILGRVTKTMRGIKGKIASASPKELSDIFSLCGGVEKDLEKLAKYNISSFSRLSEIIRDVQELKNIVDIL